MYGAYVLTLLFAHALNRPPVETLLWGFIAALLIDRFLIESRSRTIPLAHRRKVIAKWELETGQKFTPGVHEIDHIIPFAKGGDHAVYNLRVIPLKENRTKGKKSPRWDLIGRWKD